MKVRQYFLIIVMFSLLGFNAIADTCSSPTTCSNSSCTNTSGVGLACSETNSDCNCFDTGYTYWNGDTCVPNITFNSGTYSWIVQYTCDTNMHLTTTPYQCVCNSGYYMVNGSTYTSNPLSATGCNTCPSTWTCAGGTAAPYQLCSVYDPVLYNTGNAIYQYDVTGCSCSHPATVACTPTCGTEYTAVTNSGTSSLTHCLNNTYGACTGGTCNPNTYTITLDDGPGSGGVGTLQEVYGTSWTPSSPITIPTYAGHTFTGYWASTGTSPVISATGVLPSNTYFTEIATLTAQWVPNTFTITLDPNDSISTSSSVTCTIGSPCILGDLASTIYGYTFDGWNFVNNGSGTNYDTGLGTTGGVTHTFTTPPPVTTLYARWKKTITFNGNGGTPATQDVICYHNANLDLPSPYPSAPSSGFSAADSSWYQDDHGGAVAYYSTPATTCDAATITPVFPKWVYQVIYNGNSNTGGSVPAIKICTKNEDCDLTDIPSMTRTGYILDMDNWYSNGLGTGGTDYPDTGTINNPAGDITLYAKWTQCATGQWVNTGTNTCEDCPIGSYCPVGGATSPTACPPGHTTSAMNSTVITACYVTAGTGGTWFCDDGGARCFQLPDLGSPANNIIHYQN